MLSDFFRGRLGHISALISRRCSRICLLLITLALPMSAAFAVSLRGVVTDASGAKVTGANVTLLSNGEVAGTDVSQADGSYHILTGFAGRFYIVVSAKSFRQLETPGFYAGRLETTWGLTVLVPDEPGRTMVHQVIYDELVQGIVRGQSRARYLEVIDQLQQRGAEGIIAGCTEIELLVQASDLSLPYFPTTRLHALAALDAALASG